MKILLAAAAISMALFSTVAANAEVVGAHVGPLGVGIHVHHHHHHCSWRHHHRVCW
jgi:Spy/CpxP family protein refolding chaperone